MTIHEYLSTACWHELNDGKPERHRDCRATCKYGDEPEYCSCPNHTEDELRASPVSWVDQARGIAIRLYDALQAVGADLAAIDRHLDRAIREDRSLFWLRGEEQPPGEWRYRTGGSMSFDISLMIDTGSGEPVEVVCVGNYTSNVAAMWTDALDGMSLREFHGRLCVGAAEPLAAAVKRMEADPDKYRAMNPPNGWGDYEGALGYLRRLAEACVKHPRCTIWISA